MFEPPAGLEPASIRLRAGRSTLELQWQVGMPRIELGLPSHKLGCLPLTTFPYVFEVPQTLSDMKGL